jgi:hypothetical protein
VIDMTSNMTLSYRVFTAGTPVPETQVLQIPVPDGSPLTLPASEQLIVVSAPGAPLSTYTFAFWAVPGMVQPTQLTGGVPDSQQVVNFPAPSDESFNATAWYVLDGTGGPGVDAWAFSLNQDQVLTPSPFASVSPSACQEGANAVSTTDAAAVAAGQVTMIAENLIEGSGRFQQWLQFFGSPATGIAGTQLTVPSGDSSDAIAIYSIPQPDPCQPIRDQIANLNPTDFPNFADYERAIRTLGQELVQCERQYGEL